MVVTKFARQSETTDLVFSLTPSLESSKSFRLIKFKTNSLRRVVRLTEICERAGFVCKVESQIIESNSMAHFLRSFVGEKDRVTIIGGMPEGKDGTRFLFEPCLSSFENDDPGAIYGEIRKLNKVRNARF